MDFEEEDGPPLLVEVEATDNDNTEEAKPVKVPITIVTGKSPNPHSRANVNGEIKGIWEPVRLP